jgi:glycosyltransferase involved in cell wall biosynthesis
MGKKGNPALQEQLSGAFGIYSNSYDVPTGYGQQVKYLIDCLVRQGFDVANFSNFGLEGKIDVIRTPYGEATHFPRTFSGYSQEVAPLDFMTWSNSVKKKDLFFTLYDVWILQSEHYEKFRQIWSWTPLDHVTMPAQVEQWLRKPNVLPIAMSPFGHRQMDDKGIDNVYIPHSIDTKVLKETWELSSGSDVRDYWNAKDKFVVGMVAANKASGLVHRKAFSENLMAFSIFQKKHSDAVLYLHTDATGSGIGWNLLEMLKGLGVPEQSVLLVNPLEYRYGASQHNLAAYYTGMDVLLAPSMGEGFGVPTIEAQACGTRVIASNWAASQDLVAEDGWLVDGVPVWDAGQLSWWQTPNVPSIVDALGQAYDLGHGKSEVAKKFAKDFDVETVWKRDWMPLLRKEFDATFCA